MSGIPVAYWFPGMTLLPAVVDYMFQLGACFKKLKIPCIMLNIYQVEKPYILRQLLPSGTDLR